MDNNKQKENKLREAAEKFAFEMKKFPSRFSDLQNTLVSFGKSNGVAEYHSKEVDLTELKEELFKKFGNESSRFYPPKHCNDIWNLFLPYLQQPAKSEWISVEERLPEKEDSYLCFDAHHNMKRVLMFSIHHDCWDDEYGDDYYTDSKGGKVTHWQPLPPNPISKH